MDQSFGALFRASKVAAFDPRQVLTASKPNRAVGNWGLKRSLPRDLSLRYIKLDTHKGVLDDRNKAAAYKSASDDVSAMQRWFELFPPPADIPPMRIKLLQENSLPASSSGGGGAGPPRNLSTMPKAEFAELVQEAERLKSDWRHKKTQTNQRNTDPNLLTSFMNVSIHADVTPVHPPHYTISKRSDKFVINSSLPNYVPVKGRFLNQLGCHGWAIGIAGFVGYLDPSSAQNTGKVGQNGLANFFVSEATFDHKGRPEITVKLNVPENSDMANLNNTSSELYNKKPFSQKSPLNVELASLSFVTDMVTSMINQAKKEPPSINETTKTVDPSINDTKIKEVQPLTSFLERMI